MKYHNPTREAGLNGPILESLTAHHRSRKGWIAGSSTAEGKALSSWDAFYSVADEYLFPDTLAKEIALHINSVTNSSKKKKSYALNKHLMIHHLKSTGIHLLHCNVFQSPVSICSSLVSNTQRTGENSNHNFINSSNIKWQSHLYISNTV